MQDVKRYAYRVFFFSSALVALIIAFAVTGETSKIKGGTHFAAVANNEIDMLTLKKDEAFRAAEVLSKEPSRYVGCDVTAIGKATSFFQNDKEYHGIAIEDINGATITLEYSLRDGYEYPANGETAVVEGTWFSYVKDDSKYYCIQDAFIPKG